MIDTGSGRHPLEVLAAEFVERYRRGEQPSVAEYTARRPDLADKIRALFPTVVLMEDLKRTALPGADGDLPPPGRMPERLGDCRVVREVGRGGMGVVYEAEQESLGRRVAVKVLTAQALLEPDRLVRFRREARATARLHHTNIVPVFEFGEHDGLPYYVMQFIDGRGLDQEIADCRMQIADCSKPICNSQSAICNPTRVAQVGLQVAEALAYAHAQGTLHRDVKPSNLLLDARGTVWVTDFGLAKLVGQDDATAPGGTAGTLRYLAPERFRGQSDARGDVYALGLTLYELLTRRPAFDESDRGRLVRQVTQEEPPAPRRCDPGIPRDLETVVLRAMARAPEDRYPTAAELAEDLRRFLEGKPVRARRVGPAERARRWCRRNPALATLTALAGGLLVLAAGLAVAGDLQTRAALRREAALRAEAEEHRRQAEANLALARTAAAQAAEQHQEAVGQRQRAEANLALALRAFDDLFAQATRRGDGRGADPALEDGVPACPPVVSPEVAALLHRLLTFYDQFGERNRSDGRLQREIARAYRRAGDIHQRLGQFEEAEAAYRRALALHGRPAGAPADEAERAREAAAVRNELGAVLQTTGRYAEAEKAHRRALKALEGQAAGAAAARFELARTHALLGGVLARTGRLDGAEQHYRDGLDMLTCLRAEDRANPDYRLVQARAHRALYFVLWFRGRYPEAWAARWRAIAVMHRLAEDFPAVPDYRYELGEVLIQLVAGGGGPRHDGSAERQLRRAVGLARELAAAFPAVPQYQALHGRSLQRLGAFLQASGRGDEAEPLHRDAVALHHALVSRFPSVPSYHLYRADACRSLATALQRRGQLAEACALMEETIDAQQAYLKATPANPFGRMQLAHEYQALAETRRRLGDDERSREAARRAREVRNGL
jgi:tetratricopeptide (TPR) repeat protein/tRNA A-37 threonylcarbamoyl transferase component Bud32